MLRQVVTAIVVFTGLAGAADARITRIEIASSEPAFAGQTFGNTGAYQRLKGSVHGELDPADQHNSIIQDLALAPRNSRGLVEYSTEIEILRPADISRGNRVLLFEVANRGNKTALLTFNDVAIRSLAESNALTSPGDGYLLREGYALVWFGWQQDVPVGESRMLMPEMVVSNPDGSAITGVVRSEMITARPATTLPLSQHWYTPSAPPDPYPAASLDNADATLTVRAREQDPRVAIPNSEWSFATCGPAVRPRPDPKHICYPAGFEAWKIYELIYRAKDPRVMGLGFAAARDLGAFLRNEASDSTGVPNPVFRPDQVAIIEGSSQSGRMIRTFIHLGFNQDENGRRVFDGGYPHIGGGRIALNVRFAQPNHAWGEQIDHLYPAYDFPFAYSSQHDPLTGRTQGLLDRCIASATCPQIFHVATVLEMWEGRQSLGLTDPLGIQDLPDAQGVRTYIMAGTQHGPARLPLPSSPPFGNCQQQPNPNPQVWTMHALLRAFAEWVRDGKDPPPSVVPRIADGTMVAPDQVHFPPIPANTYGSVQRVAVLPGARAYDPLHVLDFGPEYRGGDSSGVISIEPPRVGTASYGVLVPQVDADGNDIAGIRSVFLQVPIGTYTGWNLGRKGWFENGFCNLQGSFIPFAATKAEREATSDPRLSLEERYPSHEVYVAAFRRAAEELVQTRLLLPEDSETLVREAEQERGIRAGP
ncbi:MAG: hypothetical protein JO227_05655 [Acetobacteraceae bacterium]|nr:hypothetical protein [Acetobacteraceae bacterium]